MPRVNYREVEHRFGHMDGTIVSAGTCVAADGLLSGATVTVSYYPWFEQPQVKAAEARGGWTVVDPQPDSFRVITIEAVSPVFFQARSGSSAIDVFFSRDHPMLWQFQDSGQIICNSDVDRRELFEGVVRAARPPATAADVAKYLEPYSDRRASYSLGYFPFSLFGTVKTQLEQMGAQIYVAREPVERDPLVALFVDELAIVARDFDVLWPDGDPIAG